MTIHKLDMLSVDKQGAGELAKYQITAYQHRDSKKLFNILSIFYLLNWFQIT